MQDTEDEDLLQHLEACHRFIGLGMEHGGVLVHWYGPLLLRLMLHAISNSRIRS